MKYWFFHIMKRVEGFTIRLLSYLYYYVSVCFSERYKYQILVVLIFSVVLVWIFDIFSSTQYVTIYIYIYITILNKKVVLVY